MFWFFEGFAKRFSEQAAEYAAAQSEVLARACGEWQGLMGLARPVRVTCEHEEDRLRLARQRAAARDR